MTIKVIMDGVARDLEILGETRIKLDIGDKVNITEYLKYFKVTYDGETLILQGANGEQIIIEGINQGLNHNTTLNLDEYDRFEDIPDEGVEELTYISFLTDEEAEDNVIDDFGSLFEIMDAAAAGEDVVEQNGTYVPTFAERTGDETNIEADLREQTEFETREFRTFESNGVDFDTGTTTQTITPPTFDIIDEPEDTQDATGVVNVKIYGADTLTKIDIPTVTEVVTKEVPTVEEFEFTNTRWVEETFTNYRTVQEEYTRTETRTEEVEVPVNATREVTETFIDYTTETETYTDYQTVVVQVPDSQYISDNGLVEEDGKYYKESEIEVTKFRDVEEIFTNYRTETEEYTVQVEKTKDVEETFTNYRTESETYFEDEIRTRDIEVPFEDIREVEETFTNYRTETITSTVHYEVTDGNLNQDGDNVTLTFGKTNSMSIDIKSYKVSSDDGIVELYRGDSLVGTLALDDIYLGKDNVETVVNINSDSLFDGIKIIHSGLGSGKGKNSQEFKVEGYTVSEITETEVPFEDTRIVTETFTNYRTEVEEYTVELEKTREVQVPFEDTRIVTETYFENETRTREVQVPFEDTRIVQEEYKVVDTVLVETEVPLVPFEKEIEVELTREVQVPFENTRVITETYTDYNTETREYTVEVTDTRDVIEEFQDVRWVEEEFQDTILETVYETITETIEYPDPDFDLSIYSLGDDGNYYDTMTLKVMSILSDEPYDLSLDTINVNITDTDKLIIGENIKVDLDSLLVENDELELIIKDSNGDDIILTDNVLSTKDLTEADIVFDHFANISESLINNMTLLEESIVNVDI